MSMRSFSTSLVRSRWQPLEKEFVVIGGGVVMRVDRNDEVHAWEEPLGLKKRADGI